MHCPHRVAGMGEFKRMMGYVDGRFVCRSCVTRHVWVTTSTSVLVEIVLGELQGTRTLGSKLPAAGYFPAKLSLSMCNFLNTRRIGLPVVSIQQLCVYGIGVSLSAGAIPLGFGSSPSRSCFRHLRRAALTWAALCAGWSGPIRPSCQ